MKIRAVTSLAAAVALVLATGTNAAESTGQPETVAPAQPADASASPSAKPMLEKGMTAEQVERIAGKPAEIKPLASSDGKAETWTYRRVIDRQTRQVAATTEFVSTFKGANFGQDETQVPVYHLEHTTIYQVTALLMFDGKLVLAKQWREKSVNRDQ